MFYTLISRFLFLLKSTDQHGVHSPFVFDFVTKGLYQKRRINSLFSDFFANEKLTKKEQIILQKTGAYFNIQTIHTSIKELENNLNKPYNLLYISNINLFNINKLVIDTSKIIVIFHNIHANQQNHQKWESNCKNKEVSVSIDLFYFGLLFFRKAQAKEHFKIRV